MLLLVFQAVSCNSNCPDLVATVYHNIQMLWKRIGVYVFEDGYVYGRGSINERSNTLHICQYKTTHLFILATYYRSFLWMCLFFQLHESLCKFKNLMLCVSLIPRPSFPGLEMYLAFDCYVIPFLHFDNP